MVWLVAHSNGVVVPVDEPTVAAARADRLATLLHQDLQQKNHEYFLFIQHQKPKLKPASIKAQIIFKMNAYIFSIISLTK